MPPAALERQRERKWAVMGGSAARQPPATVHHMHPWVPAPRLQWPPNTFFNRSVPRAAGLVRMDCSCSPITVNRPSSVLRVT